VARVEGYNALGGTSRCNGAASCAKAPVSPLPETPTRARRVAAAQRPALHLGERMGLLVDFYGKTWENAGISMENTEKPGKISGKYGKMLGKMEECPLVTLRKTMENGKSPFVIGLYQLFLWPCSIAICQITRGYRKIWDIMDVSMMYL
jgi:hypothetical protein